jgi:ABC-type dipeptide/oligopeptide/nickel transport system ATPase subunit
MPSAFLQVEHLSVTFPVGHDQVLWAVEDVTLEVPKGSVLGLVGESGCGKTTVARSITGEQVPARGVVRLNGVTLGRHRTAATRRTVQMIFQDPYSSLNPRLTVRVGNLWAWSVSR